MFMSCFSHVQVMSMSMSMSILMSILMSMSMLVLVSMSMFVFLCPSPAYYNTNLSKTSGMVRQNDGGDDATNDALSHHPQSIKMYYDYDIIPKSNVLLAFRILNI